MGDHQVINEDGEITVVTWLIDISNHQGTFDIARAAREGYSGVWLKATEGRTFRDKQFDANARQALAAGMVRGAYHYLRAGDGAAQCDAFYARVQAHGGPTGWLVACDNEDDASWATTVAFFRRWKQLAGDHPLFMYSGDWWWGVSARRWPGATLTPWLWDSRYVSGAGYGSVLYGKVPGSWWTSRYGGWGPVTVLQFSARGRVAGRDDIDVDAFRGTVDELRAFTRPPAAPPVVVPDPPKVKEIDLMILGLAKHPKRATVFAVVMTPTGLVLIGLLDWDFWQLLERDGMSVQVLQDGDPRPVAPSVDGTELPDEVLAECGLTRWVEPTPVEDVIAVAQAALDTAALARAAAEASLKMVQEILTRVTALSVGAVDVAALAAALAPMLPPVPSAADVAVAVADVAAARMTE